MVEIIGEPLTESGEAGERRSRIATAVPHARTLITLPGIHATQRQAYVDAVNAQRARGGQPPLTEDESLNVMERCVDLILDDGTVLIRPDPDNMELAFQADEMLQDLVPKERVKFLHVLTDKVRQAVQARGEAWRIHPLPQSPEQMAAMIGGARIAIGGRAIYYYNATTGTRWLTCQGLAGLERLPDAELRQHLAEIARFSALRNPRGYREVDFFMAGGAFGAEDFAAVDAAGPDEAGLRRAHAGLVQKFRQAVPSDFADERTDNDAWRNRMFGALVGHRDDMVSEESALGLSAEFFMQVEWLPGARLVEGELIFDPVLERPAWQDEQRLDHPDAGKVRGLICNLIQEYGDLESINIGWVPGSLCRGRPPLQGRRTVFIAQVKQRGAAHDVLQIIRMQKWGVRERLEQGKDLLLAMIESEDYTEYILDRRVACKQLGMNLPPRASTRKLSEWFTGRGFRNQKIWSPYFQRDYVSGLASDKMPASRLRNGAYSIAFAHLLGRAAAPNMILGRYDDGSDHPDVAAAVKRVVFDDGDEVVIEDVRGLPVEIVVADHTGTFKHYKPGLQTVAGEYALPVNRRARDLPHPQAFADCYLQAFAQRFHQIQDEYRKRRRAFDTLFKHRRDTAEGSIPYRWERILRRLDEANPDELASAIREHIRL